MSSTPRTQEEYQAAIMEAAIKGDTDAVSRLTTEMADMAKAQGKAEAVEATIASKAFDGAALTALADTPLKSPMVIKVGTVGAAAGLVGLIYRQTVAAARDGAGAEAGKRGWDKDRAALGAILTDLTLDALHETNAAASAYVETRYAASHKVAPKTKDGRPMPSATVEARLRRCLAAPQDIDAARSFLSGFEVCGLVGGGRTLDALLGLEADADPTADAADADPTADPAALAP